jgi:hypothetical protein
MTKLFFLGQVTVCYSLLLNRRHLPQLFFGENLLKKPLGGGGLRNKVIPEIIHSVARPHVELIMVIINSLTKPH